jgi:hypothetical protein
VINELVLGIRQQIRVREGGIRNVGTGIRAAELREDVIEVLLRAEPLSFEHFDNGGDLSHVGDGRFFDGHSVTLGAIVAHGMRSAGSCTNRFT